MPKAPILEREGFVHQMKDKTLREIPWNVVQTPLGYMVEPVTNAFDASTIAQVDIIDAGFTRFTQMDEGQFQSTYGTGGPAGMPFDVNY